MASNSKKNNNFDFENYKPAAVLIPILTHNKNSKEILTFESNLNKGEIQISIDSDLLFTQRSNSVEHHKGQISFPGGKFDENDHNLLQTALRETEEEIGIQSNKINIFHELPPIPIPKSKFKVTAYAGQIDETLHFQINKNEIDTLIRLPIHFFLEPKHSTLETIELEGLRYQIKAYSDGNIRIWGATAKMVDTFLKFSK